MLSEDTTIWNYHIDSLNTGRSFKSFKILLQNPYSDFISLAIEIFLKDLNRIFGVNFRIRLVARIALLSFIESNW